MMQYRSVKYSDKKAQMQIQQMAFVLVATIVFFVIVGLFYLSIRFSSLQEDVGDTRKDEVIETVRKISGSAEFVWNNFEECASCVDLDKVFILKQREHYKNFWKDVSFLQISRVYPKYENIECNMGNYPKCNKITIVERGNFEAFEAFVSLCRYDGDIGFDRCEIGKIIMGFEDVE